jgi:LmbE family N-acetylglucosaminyl deacetylase
MSENKTVLSILAHPDDCEFMCAGTLALLKEKGWDVHIATMTPGDCGSAEYNREEISKIRRAEGADAAGVIDGTYHCLECDDVFIMYDRPTLLKVIKLLREVKPAIVFAPSGEDYFIDHENTSRLVWTATFAGGMMNVDVGVEPYEPVPTLYYVDAMDGKDKYGNLLEPRIYSDITSTIDTKEKMLCCHASQRNWLLAHHGVDEYTHSMRRFAEKRGKEAGVTYGEGFRQHLGHSYPENNILKDILGDKIIEK